MNTKEFLLTLTCLVCGVISVAIDVNKISKFEDVVSYSELENMWNGIRFPSAREFRRRRKPFTINVEGIVGTGKSTFLKSFEVYPLMDVLTEPVDRWTNLNGTDLLQLIYNDPKRWGMAQESYVQLTMLQEHLRNFGVIKVMERSLQSARFVFIENLYRSGNLQPVEYNILSQWYSMFHEMEAIDVSTDLTVYLQSNPDVVLERIKRRGRKEESQITREFLWNIHRLHEDWLVHKNTTFPLPSEQIIVVNTSKPFASMKRLYKTLVKKIWDLVPNELKADPKYRCSHNFQ